MKPNFPKLGEPLTLNQIKELRQAFGVLFAVELYGPEATYFQTSWAIPDFGLSWQNTSGYNEARRVFATYAQTLTGETEPKQIDRALAEMEQIAATNPAHVFQTTPSKEALELGEQEALRREEAEKAAKEEAGASVERLKARVKKAPPAQPSREFSDLQKETVAKTEDSQKDLAGKIVYAKVTLPEQPQLSSLGADEQIAYHKFVDLAKRAPNKFVENLSSKIASNLPEKIKQSTTPEEINLYSRRVALKATEGLRHGPPAVNPEPMILAKLAGEEKLLQKVVADGKARLLVTQAATDTAVLKMLPEKITRESLARVFGPNITTQILGPDITRSTIILSEDPEGATHRVPLGDNGLLGNYRETVQNPIFANISSLTPSGFKGKLYDFGQEKLLSGLSKLPTDSFLGRLGASEKFQSILSIFRPGQTFEATNLFGNIVLKITPEYAPIVGGLGKLIGVDFGLVPAAEALTIPAPAVTEVVTEGAALKVAAQGGLRGLNIALGNSVATGAAWVAGKLGATALSAKLGAMVGTGIMPVIGTIVGAILGALLGKVIEKFVAWAKKHKEDLAIIGGIMLASGLIFRSVPLVVFGALTTLPGLMTGRALAGIGARVFFFGRQIGKSLAITIGTPVIVAIIVFPILVALILFIINSGAYIVPPSRPGLNFESPYIGVDKTANPPGPFQNTGLPLTIEYTITITAKKGTLTNIHFSESCQVIKKGASVSCPPVSGSIPQPPESISPTTPFSFKYSVTYAAGTFADSLVVNSFTVTANTAEVGGAKGVGGTSIKIGNPPEDCPNNAWPVEGNGGLNNVTQGPSAPGCTHENLPNAIDIGVDGAIVVAVHSGIVTVGEDSCTGKTIKISSTCGSVPFSSFYGHLGAVSVSTGQGVSVGQAIGISDNTGSCTSGPHLHFSFQTSSIPVVQRPYLIRDVPIGCCSIITCNP